MSTKTIGSIYHVLSPDKHAPPSTKVHQDEGEKNSLVTQVEILGIRPPTTANTTQYFIHYVEAAQHSTALC